MFLPQPAHRALPGIAALLIAIAALALPIGSASAQQQDSDAAAAQQQDLAQGPTQQTPPQLEGVEIEQKLGKSVPMDIEFTDSDGNAVTLGGYFTGDKPVIITPVYYNCPMLCTLVLNGLVDGLERVDKFNIGEDFDIVSFSFAAEEGPELASRKKRAYLTQYDRESAADGWHFLTGSQQSIDALCDAIGFKYNRLDNGEIAHSASITFVSPSARISSYKNGVQFQPMDLRLALVDASEGTIGAPLENFMLFSCFRFDPEAGSFVASAWKIMRFFGGLTVLLIAAALFMLFRAEARQKRRQSAAGARQLNARSHDRIADSRLPIPETTADSPLPAPEDGRTS